MRYVGVGRRFVAVLIDGFVLSFVTVPFGTIEHVGRSITFRLSGGDLFFPGLIWLVYFTALEVIAGATLGKMVMGIRVLREDGAKLDWASAFVRNIARIIDGFPYFLPYLVGAISVWSSPNRQRLGDRWGHTVVVMKDSVPPNHGEPRTPGAGVEVRLGAAPPPPSPTVGTSAPPPMPPPPPVPPGGSSIG